MTIRSLSIVLIAATVGLVAIGPASAASSSSIEARLAALKQKKGESAPNASAVKISTAHAVARKPGGSAVPRHGGKGTVDLTSSDCRVLGGTVVVPGDARCGKIGASYCRFPDTNAMCIED
jgi:hypothetical protein